MAETEMAHHSGGDPLTAEEALRILTEYLHISERVYTRSPPSATPDELNTLVSHEMHLIAPQNAQVAFGAIRDHVVKVLEKNLTSDEARLQDDKKQQITSFLDEIKNWRSMEEQPFHSVHTELKVDSDEAQQSQDGGVLPARPTPLVENSTLMERIHAAGFNPTIVEPATLDELKQHLIDAANAWEPNNRHGVRAMGTQYGFSDVTFTNGTLVNTNKHLRWVFPHLAGPNDEFLHRYTGQYREWAKSGKMINVQAGVTVRAVNNILWPEDKRLESLKKPDGTPYYMIKNPAGYHDLAIGGLVAVGAQGSGLTLPSVSSQVVSCRIVTVEGSWNTGPAKPGRAKVYQIEGSAGVHDPEVFQRENPDIELIQDDVQFNVVLGSVGSTGVLFSVMLELREAYFVEEYRYLTTWEKWTDPAEAPPPGSNEPTFQQLVAENMRPDSGLDSFETWICPYPNWGLFVDQGCCGKNGCCHVSACPPPQCCTSPSCCNCPCCTGCRKFCSNMTPGEHLICISTYRIKNESRPVKPTEANRGACGGPLALSDLAGVLSCIVSQKFQMAITLVLRIALSNVAHPPVVFNGIAAQDFGTTNGVPVTVGGWGLHFDPNNQASVGNMVDYASEMIIRLEQLLQSEGESPFFTGPVLTCPMSLRFASPGRGYLTMQHGANETLHTMFIEQPLCMLKQLRIQVPPPWSEWIYELLLNMGILQDTRGYMKIYQKQREYLMADPVRAHQHLAFIDQDWTRHRWNDNYGRENMTQFLRWYRGRYNASRLFCNTWTTAAKFDDDAWVVE